MAKLSRHQQKVLARNEQAKNRKILLPDHFEKAPIISWYPGHMLKAQREMLERIKIIDLIIELVDARIPFTSINAQFNPLFQNRPRLLLLNKAGLADSNLTEKWANFYREKGLSVLAIDVVAKLNIKKVLPEIRKIMEKMPAKKFRSATRCMVIGIPNVGKSSFINAMAGKKIALAGATPGLTRHQQWVNLANDIELLDTPGVMYPRIETKSDELNLAVTAGIKDEHVGEQMVAEYLLYKLRKAHKNTALKTLGFENLGDETEEELLKDFAKRRAFLGDGGVPDVFLASKTILQMFREGVLGAMTLNNLNEAEI